MKRLSCFYPKRVVEEDGIHKKPLHLQVLMIDLTVCPFLYIVNIFLKLLHTPLYIQVSNRTRKKLQGSVSGRDP